MRRFRRLRSNESIRSLVRETRVDKKDRIYPIFVAEGENIKKPVEHFTVPQALSPVAILAQPH